MRDRIIVSLVAGLAITSIAIGAFLLWQPTSESIATSVGGAATSPTVARKPTWTEPSVASMPGDRRFAAQVRSVLEAVRTGSYPERLTPAMPPPGFDVAAWKRDPEAYLAICEPGRCYQTISVPQEGTVLLQPTGGSQIDVSPGGTARLQAQASPGAPVTFTTLDGGAFENTLCSITVAANESGIAQASFTATPGTVALVRIVAASPLCDGLAEFTIDVTDAVASR